MACAGTIASSVIHLKGETTHEDLAFTSTSGLYRLNQCRIPERGARMARRDDREYSNVFEGGATQPAGMPRPEVGTESADTGH
jgi:hypothetical protein